MHEVERSVLELIPQRSPIVMVHRFEGVGADGCARASFTVPAGCLFVEGGRLTECGIAEHVAQSAAAYAGCLERAAGRGVSIGFIGSIDDLRVDRLPEVGDLLETEVAVSYLLYKVMIVSAKVMIRKRMIARCRMKVFLQHEVENTTAGECDARTPHADPGSFQRGRFDEDRVARDVRPLL